MRILLAALIAFSFHSQADSECEVQLRLKTEFGRLAFAAVSHGTLVPVQINNLQGVASTPDNVALLKALKKARTKESAEAIASDLALVSEWSGSAEETRRASREVTRLGFFPKEVDGLTMGLDFYEQSSEAADHRMEIFGGKLNIYKGKHGADRVDQVTFYGSQKDAEQEFLSENYGRNEDGDILLASYVLDHSNGRVLSKNLFIRNITKKRTIWNSSTHFFWDWISPFFMHEGKLSFVGILENGKAQFVRIADGIDKPLLTFELDLPRILSPRKANVRLFHDSRGALFLVFRSDLNEIRTFRLFNEVQP